MMTYQLLQTASGPTTFPALSSKIWLSMPCRVADRPRSLEGTALSLAWHCHCSRGRLFVGTADGPSSNGRRCRRSPACPPSVADCCRAVSLPLVAAAAMFGAGGSICRSRSAFSRSFCCPRGILYWGRSSLSSSATASVELKPSLTRKSTFLDVTFCAMAHSSSVASASTSGSVISAGGS